MFSSFSFSLYLSLLLSLPFIVVLRLTPVATRTMALFPTSVPSVSSMTSWTKLSVYRYQMLRVTYTKMGGPARVLEALTRHPLVPPHINSHQLILPFRLTWMLSGYRLARSCEGSLYCS
jgi:hypothetical protein